MSDIRFPAIVYKLDQFHFLEIAEFSMYADLKNSFRSGAVIII